ncbi:MAG: OmpA/MotB domain protein [Proteobacteria bacterium]|nr:OmpA/MotB domain protein [Pseudomonadota bacterium]
MKVKLHKLGLGLAASVVLFAALPAQAQVNKYGCIYAVDPYGVIVRDPYGRCIRTPWWTAEKDVAECGAVAVAPAQPTCETRLTQLASDINRAERLSTVKIVGHTDSKGTEEYNYKLGHRRANTVAAFLAEKGVSRSKMVASSEGELQPVAPNTLPNGRDNPEGRALNRRVEVTTITEMCRE